MSLFPGSDGNAFRSDAAICRNHDRTAKEYLSQKGLKLHERDIAQDPNALADLKKLGYMTTPVIVIDGAIIVGFDSVKIEKHAVDVNSPGV
jgi:glutaredoxin